MPCSRSPVGMGIPTCLAGFQAHTQGGSRGGSGQEVLQAHTWGGACSRGVPAPMVSVCVETPLTATAAGGTHPTGMHSCCYFKFSMT